MAWRARAATAAVGAAAITVTGLAPALAATNVESLDEGLTKVSIININDFHGRIDGSIGLNFACNVVRQQNAAGEGNYLLLSAGDNIGATPFVSSSQQDNPTIDYLNALGLQASAVGNHEFDRGFTDLTDRVIPRADFAHLGANVYERGTTTPALDEYELFAVNGLSVAVIGAVTEQTASMVSPAGIQMIDFGNPVDAVNRVAAQLSDDDDSNGEADIIIAQYHEGAGGSDSLENQVAAGGVFASIVNDTSDEVDAIFTGHTHLSYVWDGPTDSGTRPILQSGSYGDPVGVVELGFDPETGEVTQYTSSNVAIPDEPDDAWSAPCADNARYQAAVAIAEEATAEAEVLGREVIGEVTADITTAHEGESRDNRLRESTLGNLTANAWLWGMQQPGRPGADIGIMNPGGLRAELFYEAGGVEADGEVTYAEAASVHPFANTMQVIDITGAQFKELLEQQWQPEGSSRAFLKLGLSDNVRYTYDPDRAAGERVTGIWFDGAPMDPATTFTIASGSFLISGGDNFTVLQEGTNSRDSGLIDTDVFMNYMGQHSPVSPNFEKNGVAVHSALPLEATAGESVTFTVSGMDLTSLGSPDNTSFTIMVGDVEVGTADITTERIDGVPTRDGISDVTFTLPADLPGGETVLTLVADPSGTVVKVPLVVTALETPKPPVTPGPVVETDIPADDVTGPVGALAGLTLLLAAAAVLVARRRQAFTS